MFYPHILGVGFPESKLLVESFNIVRRECLKYKFSVKVLSVSGRVAEKGCRYTYTSLPTQCANTVGARVPVMRE